MPQKIAKISSKVTVLMIACSLIVLLFPSQIQADKSVVDLWDEVPTAFTKIEPIVAHLYFDDQEELNRLAGELDVWTVNHEEGYFVALLHPEQQIALRNRGYQTVVDIERTTQLHNPARAMSSQTTGIPGYACYRTVEETYSDMSQLAANNPTLVSWIDIGDSWDKMTPGGPAGYDMQALVLTNKTIQGEKPKLLFLSEVHAREFTTSEIAVRFAEYLVENYGTNADITWLLDYAEIHLIPMGNPDGRKEAEKVVMWRKNTNSTTGCTDVSPYFSYYGVDLNRNSTFKWDDCDGVGCSSGVTCVDTYRGPSPASEPETQAIQNYTTSIFPDQRGPNDTDAAPSDATGIFLTVHSFSELILFPWGWTAGEAPNNAGLETLGRKFGYFTDYEVCQAGEQNCIYATDGTTDDWAYGELGLAAYTFELGTAFFQACSDFEDTIIPANFPAFLYAFKAAHRPYQTPAGPESTQITVDQGTVAPGTPVTLRALADDTRYDSNGWGNEPAQTIAASRYTINAPSWVTGTESHVMTAIDRALDTSVEAVQATVDTTNLTEGRHMLLVESQDADGNWGVPSAVFLDVVTAPTAPGVIANTNQQTIHPGRTAEYLVTVTNAGAAEDTFTIAIADTATEGAWSIEAPATVGPIQPAGSATITAKVGVPRQVDAGAVHAFNLVITAQSNNATTTVQLSAEASEHIGYLPVIIIQSP